MRPRDLDEFIGQQHAVGTGSLIRNAIENDRIFSVILWGPPGSGKTTLARIIAARTRCHFVQFSAVLTGVKDIRAVIDTAKNQQKFHGRRTILFVDEIHRFNKSQQDAFLHHVESGLITLIGATTENPSFEVISALLSRCRVITLDRLSEAEMKTLIKRALADSERGLGDMELAIDEAAADHIAAISDGDARSALNALEIVAADIAHTDTNNRPPRIGLEQVEGALQRQAFDYDKIGEGHYNLISALHKSLRGSDPDAALYWLARMVGAGEDPFYIARRMVRFASEDIGNADPQALSVSMDAMEAYRFLGSPEGDLCLAQAAVYLATAPKSNSVYAAWGRVRDAVEKTGSLPVPHHIRNAPTQLMKNLGYARGYKYAHDYKDAFAPQDHLPEQLQDTLFYHPTDRGHEKLIKQRLDKWRELKKKS
ncbi:MAG: replication-associated recombination protein A [Desulfobacterales bacterium]|nr:replication-associated recombination protein A [Desulfobacterales bacterium]MBS3755190.1 replication-associated recombination protein A [Desulfobacterales bacterium]